MFHLFQLGFLSLSLFLSLLISLSSYPLCVCVSLSPHTLSLSHSLLTLSISLFLLALSVSVSLFNLSLVLQMRPNVVIKTHAATGQRSGNVISAVWERSPIHGVVQTEAAVGEDNTDSGDRLSSIKASSFYLLSPKP